jgi:superfamily II DNA or RNA helicase
MVNITVRELSETKVQEFPDPHGDESVLWNMRADACSAEKSVFKLQPQQRFLRRVLSPDAPTQSLLMVHGTGTGKTCTGIQIAEEFIVRPEYQNKKVFVLASQSVQENFRTQIFDVSSVETNANGELLSRQCTGRRYLDILQRTQSLKWSDQTGRENIMKSASKIIDEFYEFWGYVEFGNELTRQQLGNTKDVEAWIHKNFDNRLVIIDEAHNLRVTTESSSSEKIVSSALTKIAQIAHGMTLVLLTATPMYDSYEEILFYFNLFLWNEKIHKTQTDILKVSEFFTKTGDITDAKKADFKKLCNRYVSYVKGENPFTFPFRLDPPDDLKAKIDRKGDPDGNKIIRPIKYLTLTKNVMSQYQSGIVRKLTRSTGLQEYRTICTLPGDKELGDAMTIQGGAYSYTGIPFLSPSNIAKYSAKFATVLNCIRESNGIVFVYSNRVQMGAKLFAMCLEEHGFLPAFGDALMSTTSDEIARGSNGTYALFTSESSDYDIKNTLIRLKRKNNMDGSKIRVVITSPKVSEGVDFRYIRQIHVLDPWYNMSRIEQVLGRGMRTCSHSLLPPKQQNCTVYLHVNRHPNDLQETHDEYIYRQFVEKKAIEMAKVKQVMMGSAMDCTLELSVNTLPLEWMDLKIQQERSQRSEMVTRKLRELVAPVFLDNPVLQCDPVMDDGEYHERPLSAMLDVKDEILDKLAQMLREKPVWTQADLYEGLSQYDESLVRYILQNAVSQGSTFRDANGRIGHLEIKEGIVAFAHGEHDTLVDRLIPLNISGQEVNIKMVEMRTPSTLKSTSSTSDGSEYKGIKGLVNEAETYQIFGNPKNPDSWGKFWESFTYELREWYYVDHKLKGDDRTQHILNTLNSGVVPFYLARLIVNGPRKFYVLGPDEFYTPDKQKFVPIGDDLDAYTGWLNQLKQRFVAGKDEYFAAMKGDVFVFNADEKKVPVERAVRAKNIGGRTCSFFDEPVIRSFAKEVFGLDFPADKIPSVDTNGNPIMIPNTASPNKKGKCAWLDLIVRKSIIDKKPGVSWYTPEEFAILSEETNRKDVLARMKN